jgi:Ca2+-binding RTX toxin-like protein
MADVNGTNGADLLDDDDGVSNGADTIRGFGGDDTIYGLGGNDSIYGGSGNDWIWGGDGADYIDGGSGIDRAYYWDSDAGIIVSLFTGEGSGGTAEGDTLVGIDSLLGSFYGDTLIGSDGQNELFGWCGNDVLKGGGGDDFVAGEAGHDTLTGGAGADILWGNDGVDTASYEYSPAGVSVVLESGVGIGVGGDAEGDELDEIENLTGSAHADVLWGDDFGNILRGEGGNDSLKGFGGNDTLYGGASNDSVYGMDGNDTVFGESGNDWLTGDAGRDNLYGGSGSDTFAWADPAETGTTAATADAIWDFSFAQGDRIDLSDVDADVYGKGNQDFSFIGTDAFSGTPGEIRYYHSGGNTYIEMQTGMSVDVEGVIMLSGIHDPDASWFVL